jgi:protein TonB
MISPACRPGAKTRATVRPQLKTQEKAMQFRTRRHVRLLSRVTLLVICIGVALASSVRAAQSPGQAAADECRTLLSIDVFNQAIARCEEAVRLDPKRPDPYLMLGNAYDRLWQQETRASAAANVERLREHRRKAAENYRKFLGMTPRDTEARLRARAPALGGLLALHIISSTEEGTTEKHRDPAMLEYTNELARAPNLTKRDLVVLAAMYSQHHRTDLSVAFLTRDLKADPTDPETCMSLKSLYDSPAWSDGPRIDERIGNLELCAAQNPRDPQGYFQLAVSLWDKGFNDKTLTDPQKLAYVERGLRHIDRALALDENFWEAMVYKGLLLRTKAITASDPAVQKQLLAEATALQDRAKALKARTGTAPSLPPPPPPPPSRQLAETVTAGVVGGIPQAPVRVGGEIKQPRKLIDVPPVYPPIAQSARVQGVVILECTIAPDGRVIDAKVLRSIPLLDAAAIDAVKQWVYTPTLFNGVPVPVIMTVTVSFRLS